MDQIRKTCETRADEVDRAPNAGVEVVAVSDSRDGVDRLVTLTNVIRWNCVFSYCFGRIIDLSSDAH